MATLNQSKITNLDAGYQTLFNDAYKAEGGEDIKKVASYVPSTAGSENYPALVGVPMMDELVGDAKVQNLFADNYAIKNRTFAATVEIKMEDIEDDTTGKYDAKIREMADNAKRFPWTLLVGLLDDAFTRNDYTGKPFCSAAKPYIPGVDGLAVPTFTNYGTKQLTADSLTEAKAELLDRKDPYGNSLYVGSGVVPTLIVPGALESAARKLVALEGSKDNPLYNTCKLLVVRGIKSQTAWFLADLDSQVKPFIFQERKVPVLLSNAQMVAQGMADSSTIKSHNILYQVTSRGDIAFGAANRIFGSTGATA